jgi:catechol 2,3-dioxygenase-like lactoylglutathione lyase family enzyme
MPQEGNVMPEVVGIHHAALTVTDIERSVPWYSEVLGLTKLMEEPHPGDAGYAVVLGKPDFSFCVGLDVHPTNAGESFSETRTGLDHISFRVSDRAELDAWETRLTELGVAHSPVSDQGSFAVLVFRDPDNIQLELIALG